MGFGEVQIEKEWNIQLKEEFEKAYFDQLVQFVKEEKKKFVVYPPGKKIFAAFNFTPFSKVRVVILGQDPYHGPGQANGLSFSVDNSVKSPPSLKNIFKELTKDLNLTLSDKGDLSDWARQGVLLLNSTLTVRANSPGSHQKKGWETFTDAVIKKLSDEKKGIVFLLWGKFAQSKESLIDTNKHYILKAAHPSPLAGGAFFGCKHFSKTNRILETTGIMPIDWKL